MTGFQRNAQNNAKGRNLNARFSLPRTSRNVLAATSLVYLSTTAVLYAADVGQTTQTPCPVGDCRASIAFSYLGEFIFPHGATTEGVEFGGISGLDYDPATARFLAISDDRAERGPVRFYELDIHARADGLGVKVVDQVELLDRDGAAFGAKAVDPEAIRLRGSEIFWASEGDGEALKPPFVRIASRDGRFVRELTLPSGFAPTSDQSSGIRGNLAFEALAISPSGDVFVGLEAATHQDGTNPTLTSGSLARIIRYDGQSESAKAQYVYPISPIPQAATTEGGSTDNGLSEMIALDDRHLLLVERSFAKGFGNTIKIFMVDLDGATDVSDIASLAESGDNVIPVRKSQVLDLRAIGLNPDNIEAMAIGKGTDGEDILILAADDNFSQSQRSQFYAFKLTANPDCGNE